MISSVEGRFLEIALSELGQSYGRLRLVHPQADACMVDSLRQFGQISPVVVTSGERYELVDGFKRLRALKQLGYERVTARVLDLSVHGLKAAIPLKDHMNVMLNMVHPAYRYGAAYRGCKDKT